MSPLYLCIPVFPCLRGKCRLLHPSPWNCKPFNTYNYIHVHTVTSHTYIYIYIYIYIFTVGSTTNWMFGYMCLLCFVKDLFIYCSWFSDVETLRRRRWSRRGVRCSVSAVGPSETYRQSLPRVQYTWHVVPKRHGLTWPGAMGAFPWKVSHQVWANEHWAIGLPDQGEANPTITV